ncbi:hypothetical protein H7J51_05325 [Mycobacterium crocinum]|uniref:Uncharacterized protein n=1 Tax=Mycolicibacterium crocinum TaxID=388459 RepID=A0ABY3TK62_9MYCO|nr:hypothetical protein [Mycolicibacterium crocinum]MCV7214705.1 hypothetical protein [Mycolicibacterium crocinum]ULN41608.2 hypothetical protein MI149_00115 [Mycolicibacterium crocinum]
MTRQTITPLPAEIRRTSAGMGIWLAPKIHGPGAVAVLQYTTIDGTGHAVTLTTNDLIRLRDDASAILAASPEDIEDWFDQAADTILRFAATAGAQRSNTTSRTKQSGQQP